jgi:hypothetical protein
LAESGDVNKDKIDDCPIFYNLLHSVKNNNREAIVNCCRETSSSRKCMQNAIKAKAKARLLVDEPD